MKFDSALIGRAIENVLTHIFDAARNGDGGNILIQLTREPGNVRIVINDDFQVLSDSKLAGLFEPFAYEGEHEVHGIGLAVTQKILREHDGDIAVSRLSKQGIRFVLWLPVPEPDDDHTTGTFNAAKIRKARKKGSSAL